MALSEKEKEDLVAYLDGELDEEVARTVEARINVDPTVRAEVDALKQTWEMLDFLPSPETSQDFTQRTMQRLEAYRPVSTMVMRKPPGAHWLARLGWAAAIALALGGGFFLSTWIWPGKEQPADESAQIKKLLNEELPLLENLELYQAVENFENLKKLAQPELFGDESL